MARILKFPLELKPVKLQDSEQRQEFQVGMPKGATLLSVEWQDGVLCAWVIIHRNGDTSLYENRHFRVIRTGEHFDEDGLTYICTTQKGDFVGHIFEEYAR